MKEKELRDEFAMAVIGSVLDRYHGWDGEMAKVIAIRAYEIADACMKEREQPTKKET